MMGFVNKAKHQVWAHPVGPMEEPTLELLALQSHEPGDEEGATLPPGTLVHIDGDTLVAVVEEGHTITASSEETGPQLTELDLSSLLSAEEPEEDVLQKALLQADTVVAEEVTQEQHEPEPEPESESELQPQPNVEAQQQAQQPDKQQQQQQTVVIDTSSPIELCQNALIVVNGQRCVLQQDASTGQVLAYPIREPKRKRGRPRKVVVPPSEQEPPAIPVEESRPEEPPTNEEEEEGDTGMMDIVTEDGALVRRSCRRRKAARIMQDYHLSEDSESEPEPEPEPDEPRRRGRPPKNYHEEDPFWKRNVGRRRPRGRKREGATSSSNPMQAFLVQMADGQTLMMQIPAASIPPGMDLHQVAQNIATSLNAAAAQQALSGGCLSADGGSAAPVLVALQGAGSEEVQLQQLQLQSELQPEPQPQSQLPPQPAKRRPGRPRKRPLTPPPTPPPVSLPTPPAESVVDGALNVRTNSMPVVLPDGTTVENAAEVPDISADNSTEASENTATVVAQSLEDAVAQVLGPAADPAMGEDLVSPVQPKVESCAPSNEDTAVVPVPDKLVTLLLPKLGASMEEQQQLQCPACEFQAGYPQQLQEHLLAQHADAVERCRRCPHACLSRNALIAHYRAQHPRCVCSYCDHIADQAYAIRRHMARHTQPGSCTCPMCGKRYKDPYILKMHLKMVHMPAEVLFECSLCGKKFNRKAHLKRHTRTHNPNKPLKCPLCDYRGCERSDITKHMLIHEEPKHVCSICNRSFRHIKNKELHLKRHKGQKDYKCGVCDFYGYTFTDIRKHIERRHADPHTILCDRCGQAFKTQALLKEHQLSAQCEVYLIEQELTEYEEAAPETLLGPTDDPEPGESTLEEALVGAETHGQLVDANGQLIEAGGQLVEADGQLIEASGQLVETSEELVEASGHVLEAGSQLLELPGHQYAIVTTAAGDPTGEVSEVVQETHIVVQGGDELLV